MKVIVFTKYGIPVVLHIKEIEKRKPEVNPWFYPDLPVTQLSVV